MIQKDYEARLHELESQNVEYADELLKRDSTIHGLRVRIEELEAQLSREKGSRAALKQLYHSVDNKIMRTLTERGQRTKKRPPNHPAIILPVETDYASLLKTARLYDASEFFAQKRRMYKHNLRFGYRIVAKGYRVVRDSGLAGAKKIHRLKAGQ